MAKKILIIDDNEQDRKIVKRFLNSAGYDEIILAETGEEGLEKAKFENPDLVITDTRLPGIDGFEVCRQLRKARDRNVQKIIIVTGSVQADDAGNAKQSGADDCMEKTSDCRELIDVVKKYI